MNPADSREPGAMNCLGTAFLLAIPGYLGLLTLVWFHNPDLDSNPWILLPVLCGSVSPWLQTVPLFRLRLRTRLATRNGKHAPRHTEVRDGWIALLVAAATFPVWMLPAAMLGFGVGGPLVASSFWGACIAGLLGIRRAWISMLVLGLLVTALGALSLLIQPGFGVFILVSFTAWHLGHPAAIADAYRRHQVALRRDASECQNCRYPTVGLPAGAPCPECGREHTDG